MAPTPDTASTLIAELNTSLLPDARLGKLRRYLAGDHDLPYIPRGATTEFAGIAKRAVTNWLPLFPETFSRGLYVDGYRATNAPEDSPAWAHWQANGLDARQTIAHRSALEYGTSYVLVLPSDAEAPSIRPFPATKAAAWYLDDDDEFPQVALFQRGKTAEGLSRYDVVDAEALHEFVVDTVKGTAPQLVASVPHGLDFAPVVRFRDRLDAEAVGIVQPLLTVQDRLNELTFNTMVAVQYASFRQRWATGLAVPVDEDGRPVEPFKAAVNRLWVSPSSDTKFGDFAQTEIQGHLSSYDSTVRTMAGIGQIPPNILTGDLVNLSAEALAALASSTQKKIGEYEILFGEAWELVLRVSALVSGDAAGADDAAAQVRWRDTAARSLAQTVDALGKMTQMLQVPPRALWSRIPGVTDSDVADWKVAADDANPLGQLAATLTAQAQDPTAPEVE